MRGLGREFWASGLEVRFPLPNLLYHTLKGLLPLVASKGSGLRV